MVVTRSKYNRFNKDSAGRKKEFASFFPGLRQFDDNPKSRRLQFMRTRYKKPKCRVCKKIAIYGVLRKYWCKEHIPEYHRRKLDLDWQMSRIILPIADNLAKMGVK